MDRIDERFTNEELTKITALQRLAYEGVEEVARGLRPGVTEREAARRVEEALRRRGVDGFFHTPFVWFGDRTGFIGFRPTRITRPHENITFAKQFFPTTRTLEPGMIGILDVAPIKERLIADVSYVFTEGNKPHAELAKAKAFLRQVRDRILEGVRAERTMRVIYRDIDDAIAQAGYENAHTLYPSHVIGHRVGHLPFAWAQHHVLNGFDVRTYLYFAALIASGLPKRGPLWNGTPLANAPPPRGLWAIEPHIRCRGFGAKFEELLLITDSDARWLDDDLPHLREAVA